MHLELNFIFFVHIFNVEHLIFINHDSNLLHIHHLAFITIKWMIINSVILQARKKYVDMIYTSHWKVTQLNLFIFLIFFNFTILYWFCYTSTSIHHGCTRVPHPEPSSLLPPHTIPLGCPSAPAPSILYPASNLDWWFISYMILYMFKCHSPKLSHPLSLPQSPKGCSIHLCLFCSLTYRVIITVFLNSLKN